jgi:hypothetical protein
MWKNIGASIGTENGGKLRNPVAREMTSSQLETEEDLARECVCKKYYWCWVEFHSIISTKILFGPHIQTQLKTPIVSNKIYQMSSLPKLERGYAEGFYKKY